MNRFDQSGIDQNLRYPSICYELSQRGSCQLEKRIDKIFSSDHCVNESHAAKLLDIIRENYSQSVKKIFIRTISITVLWILGFGVSKEIFAETSFFSITPKDQKTILLVLPPLIGILFYSAMTAISLAYTYKIALGRLLKHYSLPIWENDLTDLFYPANFFTAEVLYNQDSSRAESVIYAIWISFLMISVSIFPIAALAHISHAAFENSPLPLWLTITSIVIAGLIAIRSVGIFIRCLYFHK